MPQNGTVGWTVHWMSGFCTFVVVKELKKKNKWTNFYPIRIMHWKENDRTRRSIMTYLNHPLRIVQTMEYSREQVDGTKYGLNLYFIESRLY